MMTPASPTRALAAVHHLQSMKGAHARGSLNFRFTKLLIWLIINHHRPRREKNTEVCCVPVPNMQGRYPTTHSHGHGFSIANIHFEIAIVVIAGGGGRFPSPGRLKIGGHLPASLSLWRPPLGGVFITTQPSLSLNDIFP